MVSQVNFTRTVLMPSAPCDHCILRARYVSHNVDEIDPPENVESIFYNCADISLNSDAPASSADEQQREEREIVEDDASVFDCCAPDQFTVTGHAAAEANQNFEYSVYYDKKMEYVRWDRVDLTNSSNTLITITNYTAGYGQRVVRWESV